MREQPHRLIFLDETGTNTKMTREYGRSLRGERLKGTAPFRRWGNQTLIAGLSCDGIVAPWVISGAMDRDAFDTYVEKVLIPELDPGSVVILDNHVQGRFDPMWTTLFSRRAPLRAVQTQPRGSVLRMSTSGRAAAPHR